MLQHHVILKYFGSPLADTLMVLPNLMVSCARCLTRMSLKLTDAPGGAWLVRKLEACPKRWLPSASFQATLPTSMCTCRWNEAHQNHAQHSKFLYCQKGKLGWDDALRTSGMREAMSHSKWPSRSLTKICFLQVNTYSGPTRPMTHVHVHLAKHGLLSSLQHCSLL